MAGPELSPRGTPTENRAFPSISDPKLAQGGVSHASGRQYTQIASDKSPIPSQTTHTLTDKTPTPKAQSLNSHTATTEISSEKGIITPTAIKALLGERTEEAPGFSSDAPVMTEEKDVSLESSGDVSDEDLNVMGSGVEDLNQVDDDSSDALKELEAMGFNITTDEEPDQVNDASNDAMKELEAMGFNISTDEESDQVSDASTDALKELEAMGFNIGTDEESDQVSDASDDAMKELEAMGFNISTDEESDQVNDASDDAMKDLEVMGFNVSAESEAPKSTDSSKTIGSLTINANKPSQASYKEELKNATKAGAWSYLSVSEAGHSKGKDIQNPNAIVDDLHKRIHVSASVLKNPSLRENFHNAVRSHSLEHYSVEETDEETFEELVSFVNNIRSEAKQENENKEDVDASHITEVVATPLNIKLDKQDKKNQSSIEKNQSNAEQSINKKVLEEYKQAKNKEEYNLALAEKEKNEIALELKDRIAKKNILEEREKNP